MIAASRVIHKALTNLQAELRDQIPGQAVPAAEVWARALPSALDSEGGHIGGWTESEKTRWLARFQARPPQIVRGWPRKSAKWPLWAIVLSSEGGGMAPLGHRTGNYLSGANSIGESVERTVTVYLFAETPDELDVHHEVVSIGLYRRIEWMIENELVDDADFGDGGDVAPAPELLPDDVYVRAISWKLRGMRQDAGAEIGPAQWSVYTHLTTATVDGVAGAVET